MHTTQRNAFTLIELLIVVAIIAIFASLCLATIQIAKDSAESLACKNRLKTIGLALAVYAQDNRGFFPIDTNRGIIGVKGWGQAFWNTNPEFIELYGQSATYSASENNLWKRMLIDPADPNPGWFANDGLQRHSEYSANAYMVGRWNLPNFPYTSMRISEVVKPSLAYLVSDGGDPSYGGSGVYGVSAGDGLNTLVESNPGPAALHSLHKSKLNILFVDQHIEIITQSSWPTSTSAGTFGNDFWMKYP
jgi:prepilin-type N-terminal cleavage/methylation domain-containing protein